jgi:N-carbamoyl-L-amino-acid hydrolase
MGRPGPITAVELARRMAGLEPIGLSATGTNRLAWTREAAAAAAWFEAQAASVDLAVRCDPACNLWALPHGSGPWYVVASHLDSVRDGGRFDGALGVAAGFEVAGTTPVPVAVVSFADEEGARFNTPTFGSKALTGALDPVVLERVDDDGTSIAAAMRAAGVDPSRIGDAPAWLDQIAGLIELHIDQTPDLHVAGQPAGVVSRLAHRVRLRADLEGRADHAGTTRPTERADALAAAARLIVAAHDLAPDDRHFVATASRIVVAPNATTTVPATANVWLDGRAGSAEPLAVWQEALEERAAAIARAGGVGVQLSVASQGAGVEFDGEVRAALRAAGEELGTSMPELVCFAGHDAGVVAARRPAGMVLVRNRSGVSHSPQEEIDYEDAAVAANAVVVAIERLTATRTPRE